MSPSSLARRLGLGDAIFIGLGSMIGAGVFAVFGPAAEAAGVGLVIGLLIAGVIAYCNAMASAQLAAVYPASGGTYIYGRERLGPWWGFTAGWGFIIGKTASCAAMALTFAAYAAPGSPLAQRAVAIAAVAVITALNYRGVRRTAYVTRVLVVATLIALAILVLAIAPGASLRNLGPLPGLTTHGWYGTLQAAGLLFFAFAGYARIATLGEEVRDPARAIPRAIPIALGVTFVVYLVVGASALLTAGPENLARAAAPLVEVARLAGSPAAPVAQVGAALASLGALLALMAGVSRTGLAMARHGDLPRSLARVHPRFHVPHRADVVLGAVVVACVALGDIRGVIGFSSFAVLTYYAIANLAALTQRGPHRLVPRALQVLGLVGCVVLALTLPITAVLAGITVLGLGLGGRWVVQLWSKREPAIG